MTKLVYDCYGAHLVGETRNAWVVVRELGIRFGDSEGMAIADACYFYGVDVSTLPIRYQTTWN